MEISIGLARIRAQYGLRYQLSQALGITRAAVNHWRRVPAERVLAVERLTGISRHDLRPDLYPQPYRRQA